MLDPLFSEAWIHAPKGHTVLGRKLHHLCAADLLVLESINSPFLVDGQKAGLEDLLIAVWILSNDHPADGTVGSLEPDENPGGKEWVTSLDGKIDVERAAGAVKTYFEDYWSLPEMMRTVAENPLTPLGAPWMLRHVITVARHLHVPLREAWLMPIGQLIWYCCAIEESESDESRIVGPDMRRQLEAAKKSVTHFRRLDGETDQAFADRVGVPVEMLLDMLKNPVRSTSPVKGTHG